MRTIFISILGSVFLFLAPAATLAGDATTARAIVDAAIKAHGGPEKLAKTALMTRQAKGVMSLFGQEVPFTDELILQLPERWRWTLDAGEAGQKSRLLLVVNGDKGWRSSGGAVMDVGKERLEELREEAYVIWLSTLLPFAKDNSFSLTPLPDIEVDGRPAAGVNVAHKGHTDVKLYFDKRTGLLVKIARRGKEAGLALDKEYVYSAHKSFEGVELPTKYVELANGKKYVEVEEISYKFLPSVNDSTFAQP
jgi:hypothetical protein